MCAARSSRHATPIGPGGFVACNLVWAIALLAPCAQAQMDLQATEAAGVAWQTPAAGRMVLSLQPSQLRSAGAVNGLDLALHWQPPLPDGRRLDISAWRETTPAAAALLATTRPSYGARVEMALASARARPLQDLGFIGLRLDNGARILLKRTNGNPTLYYRVQF
jgi:hypothetical protein